MSEKKIACYNGIFSSSIFKFIGQGENLTLATENINAKKYLVFNDAKENGFDEYNSFIEIIDFVCNKGYLDRKKIDKLRELASDLNNILIEKRDYDSREKIFDAVNKIRLTYIDLMDLLDEISSDLKNKLETVEEIKLIAKYRANMANFAAVYNKRFYKIYSWLYNKIVFRGFAWIIGLFSNFSKARQAKCELNKKKSELKKLESIEKIEMLINYQYGILMSNKIFFADLGSRLCDALENGDNFNNKSIDEILKSPTENTKVFYIDQGTENLKSFGNGLVNTIYELADSNKVLKFGKIFIDPLSIKLNNEFAYKDASLYQEKNMGNIKDCDIKKEDEELYIKIKELTGNMTSDDKMVSKFFKKLAGTENENKKFLHRVAALINNVGDLEDVDEIKRVLYDFESNEINKQTVEDDKLKQDIKKAYNELINFIEDKNVRKAMRKIEFILIELNKKYAVLVNTAFRNNIAYELASMFGFDCIVKTNVGVGKTDYISIMDKLKGQSFSAYFNNNESKNGSFKVAKKYFESVVKLMVIDYLLAQCDRHNNNFFVDIDFDINVVSKIIGIDNDFILAVLGEQKIKIDKYNLKETKLPVLFKEIKDSILAIDEKNFVGLLDFCLDSKTENKKLAIEDAKKRFADLKSYVKEVEIIDDIKDENKIVNKFINAVKEFEKRKKNEIKKEKNKPTRLYGNPIFQNVKYGNKLEIVENKKNNIPALDSEINKSDKSTSDRNTDIEKD